MTSIMQDILEIKTLSDEVLAPLVTKARKEVDDMCKRGSIMQDHSEIQELVSEMNHVCPFCESEATCYDNAIQMHWCNDCLRWDDEGDDGEESREDIGNHENAIIDRMEK